MTERASAVIRVLVAVDDTEGSVHAAETAHRLFGDDAEYLAVNVTNVVDLTAIPWYGAGWGAPYPAPYGTVWAYRADVTDLGSPTAPRTPPTARPARSPSSPAWTRCRSRRRGG